MIKFARSILVSLILLTLVPRIVKANPIYVFAPCGETAPAKNNPVNRIETANLPKLAVNGTVDYGIAVTDAFYVANRNNGTVSRIVDMKIDKTWIIGGQPYGLTYSEANQTLWVADFAGDSLYIIDPMIDDKPQRIKVGAKPLSMIFDEVSGGVWVALYGANQVIGLDADGNLDKKITTPTQPSTVLRVNTCVDYYLLVALGGTATNPDNHILIVNPGTGRISRTVQVGKRPIDLAWDATFGLLYVANFGDQSLSAVDVDEGKVQTRYPLSGAPLALSIGKACLWVALDNQTLVALNTSSHKVVNEVSLSGIPTSIVWSESNKGLWVATTNGASQGRITFVPESNINGCDQTPP